MPVYSTGIFKERVDMRAVCTMAVAALSVPLACWPGPGHAQRSEGVKELMGRAQSESERRAVEDLINKLQGRPAAPKAAPAETAPAPAAPPAPPPSASAAPAPAAKAAPAPVPAATPEPPKPAVAAPVQPAPVAPAAPAATQPANVATPPPAPALAAPAAANVQPPSTPAMQGPAPSPQPPAATAAPKEAPAPVRPAAAAPAPSPPAPTPPAAASQPPPPAKAAAAAERDQPPAVDLEVYFEFASAKLTPQAEATLVLLGRTLTDPRLADRVFIIGGFTDAKGKADYNLRLSQQRAEAVREFLVTEFKIQPSRLVARGYGATQLKNTTRRDADENRRVRIINWSTHLDR